MSTSTKFRTAKTASKTESLREQIYGELLKRLRLGQIDKDTKLVDHDVARQFGTSRMPAREALLQLVNEGYLVGTSRGFRVPRLDRHDIRDIFEVRKLLEPYAAGLAASVISKQGLNVMREAVVQARQAAVAMNTQDMIEANSTFRSGWLNALPNERLISTIERFSDHVQVVRMQTLGDQMTREYVADGLESILDAFDRGDVQLVTDRMQKFIKVAEKSFFEPTTEKWGQD